MRVFQEAPKQRVANTPPKNSKSNSMNGVFLTITETNSKIYDVFLYVGFA